MGQSLDLLRQILELVKVQREKKLEFVKQFNSILKDKEFMLVADYKGLNVSQISSLREQIGAANSNFKVANLSLLLQQMKVLEVEKIFH